MSSTNQSPQYQKAEAKFLAAQTDEQRLAFLEEMIKECPKHKSAEKMLAQLRSRHKKLKEKIEKNKKAGKSKTIRSGIKKEEMQAVIVGLTNAGKSSLISLLTNTSPKIADYDFTTKKPVVGMMSFAGVKIQIIENPAFESEFYDKGLTNNTDTIVILITEIDELKEIEEELQAIKAKKIVVFNDKKNLSEQEKRKISARLQSKKYNYIIISAKANNPENIEALKEKIFKSFDKIRVYTKPDIPDGKKSEKPILLKPDSTAKDVAEKTIKDMSEIKQVKIWGPSSKFPGQVVGLKHELKDLDVVEFKTR